MKKIKETNEEKEGGLRDGIPQNKKEGGLGDAIPQNKKEGGLGDAIPHYDTSWIDEFKQAESVYNHFYKESVNTVTIYLLYVNKENELDRLYTDKCVLSEDGYIKRDVILSTIKRHQVLCSLRYKLLSLIKYNIDLEPTDIHDFLYENMKTSDKRFISSEKYLNDIRFDKSIQMFQDMNALFFIFYEETAKQALMTKKVKLSEHHKKTKRNIHMVKNLKINKQ